MRQTHGDDADDAPLPSELVDRLADEYTEVPGEIIASQAARLAEGVTLLGGDPELGELAETVLRENLDKVDDALKSGARQANAEPDEPEPEAEAEPAP
ncbi:MAG TPA: hypothetical protein VGL93_28920 [Streptosporangiaceae bacterium]|jgi:hypothetical protein